MKEISDIEGVRDCQLSSDEDEEQLKGVFVSGVKDLEIIFLCVNCNKSVTLSSSDIVTCETCSTTQKLSDPKMIAKLIVHSQTHKLTMRASGDILKAIARSETVTAQHILFASMFNCTYNKVSRP